MEPTIVMGMMEIKPSRRATRWRWLPILVAIGMKCLSIQSMKAFIGEAMVESFLLGAVGPRELGGRAGDGGAGP